MDKVLEYIDEKLQKEYDEIRLLECELRILRTLFTVIENEPFDVTSDSINCHIGICEKCRKYMAFNECNYCVKRTKVNCSISSPCRDPTD